MRWYTDGIKFVRGDRTYLAFKLDNVDCWLRVRGTSSTYSQKSRMEEIGRYTNSKSALVTYAFDDEGNLNYPDTYAVTIVNGEPILFTDDGIRVGPLEKQGENYVPAQSN